MPIALLALSLGGFGIGLTEFSILGLLPEVAADLRVSEVAAGWLVSGYALAVAVGGVAIPLLVSRFDRKYVLLGLLALFVAGNVISALAPNYAVMMLGRIVAAACHGAFFGIGAVVAAGLVAKGRGASAIAVMFTGLTLANVLGVPLGTLLGQQLGWRSTFWAIAVVGVIAQAAVALLIPRTPAPTKTGGTRDELRVFGDGAVWGSLALTVLGFGGLFGAFTYIAFTLTRVSGFSAAAVPWLLIAFGAGTFIGNTLGGRLADRSIPRTIATGFGLLAATLATFALTATHPAFAAAALLVMGVVGFLATPALQARVLEKAGDAPTLASGANIAAFNVGNALGAWLGGLTISAGIGFTGPLWTGAAMAAAGLVLLGVLERPRRAPLARMS